MNSFNIRKPINHLHTGKGAGRGFHKARVEYFFWWFFMQGVSVIHCESTTKFSSPSPKITLCGEIPLIIPFGGSRDPLGEGAQKGTGHGRGQKLSKTRTFLGKAWVPEGRGFHDEKEILNFFLGENRG